MNSTGLLRFLPDVKKIELFLIRNGYKKIKTVIDTNLYSVSGESIVTGGATYKEIWDALKNIHFVIQEHKLGNTTIVSELVRERLDGTPFRFYNKTKMVADGYESTYLYQENPKMIYRRFFNKATGEKTYTKVVGNSLTKPLFSKNKIQPNIEKPKFSGERIRQEVVEKDGTVSTYILNPKTQCVYKRSSDAQGKPKAYYKITPDGVINLFPNRI